MREFRCSPQWRRDDPTGDRAVTTKVALISNTAWYLYNFQRGLIAELRRRGYDVLAIAPWDDHAERLQALGATFRALVMDNKGTNPLRDLRLCIALRRLLRKERPRCVMTFTVKPNIFGAFAATSLGIPVISNVSGLGTVFINRTWVTRVVRFLYRSALRTAAAVFFQNPEDLKEFRDAGLVDSAKARLVPGSGVDVRSFIPQRPEAGPAGRFRFLMLGRLLWDKGVGEFVAAAEQMRRRFPQCEFVLMGFTGADNRTAVSLAEVLEWERRGVLTYVAPPSDVRPHLAQADCVVLPSYREGMPKALLEASSMAIPVIFISSSPPK